MLKFDKPLRKKIPYFVRNSFYSAVRYTRYFQTRKISGRRSVALFVYCAPTAQIRLQKNKSSINKAQYFSKTTKTHPQRAMHFGGEKNL